MRLTVSSFPKATPQESQLHASVEMQFLAEHKRFLGATGEIMITGEPAMQVVATCTEPQRNLSIGVIQNQASIINLWASLENYAHAQLLLPSGRCLSIHIERNPVDQAQ